MGGGPTRLNLTAGTHPVFGEDFHFFNIADIRNIGKMLPGYFDPEPTGLLCDPPRERWSNEQVQEENAHQPLGLFSPTFTFWLKHQVKGFFTTSDNGGDMNADDKLGLYFANSPSGSGPNPKMMSSVLHLFGTNTCPSPTLVLGKVYRRYADYSAIVLDATGDRFHDACLTYLKEADTMPSPPASVKAGKTSQLGPTGLPEGTEIIIRSSFSCSNLLGGDLDVYKSKMCRIVENEPYLRSHDCLYHCVENDFFPQASSFPGQPGGLAVTTSTFKLDIDPSFNRTAPFFEYGDLAALPMDYLKAKCPFTVNDFEEFCARFICGPQGDQLVLDTGVLIKGEEKKEFVFPPNLIIAKGGLIVFEKGDVLVEQIIVPGQLDEFLVVVALNGNIKVNNSTGKRGVAATLIAPQGRIIPTSQADPINISGGVVVKNLPADGFPVGGRISYNTRTDPSSLDYADYYRGAVSSIASSYREIQ